MEPFKNNLSPELVFCIADHLQKQLVEWDRASFETPVLKELPDLELKARAQLIADHLHQVLPKRLTARYRVIRAMLHPSESAQSGVQSNEAGICGWGMLPLGMVVGQHGLADFDKSLALLKEMTKRFSAEFDVRYFLLEDQERALQIMGDWTHDPNFHVRRLVSEGTRPRLPWGMQLPRLIADPSPTLPILTALRDDEEEYVRRSVANHLNDISKDHPDLVAKLAGDWMKGADKGRQRLVRHACRTLIKQGHPAALKVFGHGPPRLKRTRLNIETAVVTLGESLVFNVDLRSQAKSSQSLVIDYIVHFKKANGQRSGKVFKWKTIRLEAGEAVSLQRSHPLRPVTTRRYYAGRQALSVRINGQDFGFEEFELQVETRR